jgi:uncharacterized protein YneF (UPF0154 family)
MGWRPKLHIDRIVRDYLAKNPGANPEAIQAMLAMEKGVTISVGFADRLKDLTPEPRRRKKVRQSSGGSVNKSQAIREFLALNPAATTKMIRDAMRAKGIEVSHGLTSNALHKWRHRA